MLYLLFEPLQQVVSGFRLFNYITFRAAWAAVLAFLVATYVGPGIVASLRRRKVAGYVKTGSGKVDEERERKAGVPTMGGVILLVGVALSGFLFARLDTPYTWIALLSFLAFGALGALDDYKKLKDPKSTGMKERHKLMGQLAIAFVAITALYALGNAEGEDEWLRGPSMKPNPYAQMSADAPAPRDPHRADLQIPFVKSFCLDLGLLFVPLGMLVIVGASNAVNLTDGLDGLAIGITATVAAAFAVIAYVVGRVDFSRELHVFYVPEGGELTVIAAALAGGSLGFLWFNSHPAEVFMGDTGSLSIGGMLGVLAVSLRHEITLAIAGAMFVAEAASVIWQRTYFKATRRAAARRGVPNPTGKRWFKCAPLHHHYQFLGLHENKVTVRFWIVSVICVLVALASLKIR